MIDCDSVGCWGNVMFCYISVMWGLNILFFSHMFGFWYFVPFVNLEVHPGFRRTLFCLFSLCAALTPLTTATWWPSMLLYIQLRRNFRQSKKLFLLLSVLWSWFLTAWLIMKKARTKREMTKRMAVKTGIFKLLFRILCFFFTLLSVLSGSHFFGLLCSFLKSQKDVEYNFILLFYLQHYFYDFYIIILNATFNYNSQSFERRFTGGRFG